MKWSAGMPTQGGFYWQRTPGRIPIIIFVVIANNNVFVWDHGTQRMRLGSDCQPCEWAGPLAPPVETEKPLI